MKVTKFPQFVHVFVRLLLPLGTATLGAVGAYLATDYPVVYSAFCGAV